MDTLVDPVEMVSASHLPVAVRTAPVGPAGGARASLPSVDPEAQVQWFSRDLQVFQDEPATAVDIPVLPGANGWDEENDTAPTLVLRRRALG